MMEALYREIIAREVLAPSECSTLLRDNFSRSSLETTSHSRSLVDSFSHCNNSSSSKTDNCSLLSRALNDNNGFSRMDDSVLRRYAKLEPDDLSYTNAVNPNEITRDRVRKKDHSRNNVEVLNPDRTSSNDLDFGNMDHDTLSTNHSSSFTMLDHESNSLYSRFEEEDSNFSSPFNGDMCEPNTLNDNLSSSYKSDSLARVTQKDLSLNDSSFRLSAGSSHYRDSNVSEPFNTSLDIHDSSHPVTGGVHGTGSDTSNMDTVFMGDVTSSSEVPFNNWQGQLDQVCDGEPFLVSKQRVMVAVFPEFRS